MYKLNIILILCLCASIFTYAAPLNIIPSHPSSTLTARSAMPLELNSNGWTSANRQVKKRGLVIPTLDLAESEIEKASTIKNHLIKRDPISYTVDPSTKDSVVHTKRTLKKARRSIVRKNVGDNNKLKRNEE